MAKRKHGGMRRAAAVCLAVLLLGVCVNGCAENNKDRQQQIPLILISSGVGIGVLGIILACAKYSDKKNGRSGMRPGEIREREEAKHTPVKTKILTAQGDGAPGDISVSKGAALGGLYAGWTGAIVGAAYARRHSPKTTFKVWYADGHTEIETVTNGSIGWKEYMELLKDDAEQPPAGYTPYAPASPSRPEKPSSPGAASRSAGRVAEVYREPSFPVRRLRSEADIDSYVEAVRKKLKRAMSDADIVDVK